MEREKMMRGMKVDDAPITPMNQIYYNFIKPHQGLKGKTPAEAAGIDFESSWMGLIKRGQLKINK